MPADDVPGPRGPVGSPPPVAGPLVASSLDRYHPTLEEFLAHVDRLRERSGWERSLREARIERVQAVDGGFDVDGHGRFRHVLLAPGQPGLNIPEELRFDPRVIHSYEPHDYAATVTVVGAGLAAATEWLNALEAGAEVVSVRRREPIRRLLNVPREYFSRRGLGAFHRLGAASVPRACGRCSLPPIRLATRGISRLPKRRQKDASASRPSLNGSEQVICATGFLSGFRHDPLLSRLVDEHRLETVDGCWIVVGPDGSIPALTDATRTLALAGAPRQWAFPAADTLAGARYVGAWLPAEGQGMSYTLRGRIESRLAALLPVVAVACVLTAVSRPLVAGPGGRAHGGRRARARRAGLRPLAAINLPGPRSPSASSSSAS